MQRQRHDEVGRSGRKALGQRRAEECSQCEPRLELERMHKTLGGKFVAPEGQGGVKCRRVHETGAAKESMPALAGTARALFREPWQVVPAGGAKWRMAALRPAEHAVLRQQRLLQGGADFLC